MMDVRNVTLRDYKVRQTDIYSLMLIHCSLSTPASLSFTLELMNGDSQLPLGEVPLKEVYLSSGVAWSFILLWLAIMMIQHRRSEPLLGHTGPLAAANSKGLALHVGFILVMVVKLVSCIAAWQYWLDYENTGSPSHLLKVAYTFLYATSECFLFAVLLLVAKGWRITTDDIGPNEARAFFFTNGFLVVTLFFFSVYDDGYYFLSLMILYFFLVPKVFQSITNNASMLRSLAIYFQTRRLMQTNAAQPAINRAMASLDLKFKLYTRLRVLVTWYLGVIILANFLKVIIGFYYEWVLSADRKSVV